MIRPPDDIDVMRSFLAAIAAASGGRRSPSVDASATMSAFLIDVRRLGTDATDSTFLPLPVTTDLAKVSVFIEDVRRLAVDASPFAAVPDIWGLARIGRDEQRNARILAWILDPRGSHGLGASILVAFVTRLRARWTLQHPHSASCDFPFPSTIADCRVRLELNPFGDLSRRVDIALDGREFTAFLEVKVDAPEGAEQLAAYLALSERRAATSGTPSWGVVFLAPRLPARLSAVGPKVLLATWADVRAAVREVIPRNVPDLGRTLIRQFATHTEAF